MNEIQDILQTILNSSKSIDLQIDNVNSMIQEYIGSFNNKEVISNCSTKLLRVCGFEENTCPLLSEFLIKFNRWLVESEQVDLNDLNINPNHILQEELKIDSIKVSYGYILQKLITV